MLSIFNSRIAKLCYRNCFIFGVSAYFDLYIVFGGRRFNTKRFNYSGYRGKQTKVSQPTRAIPIK